jgi:hypothetical protein
METLEEYYDKVVLELRGMLSADSLLNFQSNMLV